MGASSDESLAQAQPLTGPLMQQYCSLARCGLPAASAAVMDGQGNRVGNRVFGAATLKIDRTILNCSMYCSMIAHLWPQFMSRQPVAAHDYTLEFAFFLRPRLVLTSLCLIVCLMRLVPWPARSTATAMHCALGTFTR